MSLQRVKQGGGEAEVTLHELVIVLGAVDASEIEHEVALLAPCVELLGGWNRGRIRRLPRSSSRRSNGPCRL